MTATATAAPVRREDRPGELAGVGTLVRFLMRRDRVRLPAWTAGFGLMMVYFTAAVPAAFGTEEDLAGGAQLFHAPVGRMLSGPGYGLEAPTYENVVAGGYGLYVLLLAALMNILLVSRHTRVEEQTGRAELVRANVVGRHAPLAATLLVAGVTNAIVAVVVALVLVGVGGFATGGSLLFAAGVAATGLAFAGVAVLTAQLTEYSRTASGMAGAVIGAAFVVRAGGDMAAAGGSTLSWFSPLAWAQQTAPYVLDRWWPLLLTLGFGLVVGGTGAVLSARRDHAASLVAPKPGRARAHPRLGTPFGLALRLNRASIVGWSIGMSAGGFVYGIFTGPMLDAIDDLPPVFVDLFGDSEQILGGYFAYMALFMALVAGVYAVLAVQGLRAEETSGRAEPVLAGPVSRSAWYGSYLAVATLGVVILMTAAGVAIGVGAVVVTGDPAHVWQNLAAHLNQIPAVLVVLGLAGLLYGVLPRAFPLAWIVVGYGLFVGTFASLLDLPAAAHAVSPFEHPASIPAEPFAPLPFAALLLVAAGAAAIGAVGLRRREIRSD